MLAETEVRIAIVYDCLYPNTVGGAERWYRNLAERLDERHAVTYLTRQQWAQEGPRTSFRTLAVAPGGNLYASSGRRRIWPPLSFGAGVFFHLLRHGRDYDVVHAASFPYFSLLGASIALRLARAPARLVVDWHEVWSREYWRSYLGPVKGRIGYLVQALCLRLPDRSFTFSRMAEQRLHELGHRASITRLTGEFGGQEGEPRGRLPAIDPAAPPLVLAAGRHIPEKRLSAIPAAVAAALEQIPELRCVILGDGPETEAIRAKVQELGLEGVVEMPGRVETEEVRRKMTAASCLLHPSEREGYGLVVVEAAALGTPAILVRGTENAATELVEEGVNGFVASTADPEELGSKIVEVVRAGSALRNSTLAWYEGHREELSVEGSLAVVEAAYGDSGA